VEANEEPNMHAEIKHVRLRVEHAEGTA